MKSKTLSVLGLLLAAVVTSQAGAVVPANIVPGKVIQGNFAVSPTGAATYQIPLWMPKGVNGINPQLTLTYSSDSGMGTLGPGWSLAGLSQITTCPRTYAQDGNTLTLSGFCLDGVRLRAIGPRVPSGANPSATFYQNFATETADYSKIQAWGDEASGPRYFYFIVQTKDGLTYEYGNTNDSRVFASGATKAHAWLLNRLRSASQTAYSVQYGTGAASSIGVGLPLKIIYEPGLAGYAPSYSVSFAYTPRVVGGATTHYVDGHEVTNNSLLTSITVNSESTSTIVRQYLMDYAVSPTTSRQRLTGVYECADGNTQNCAVPSRMAYQDGGVGVSTASVPIAAISSATTVLGTYDVDGDGREDVVYASGGYIYVAFASNLSTGVSTGVPYPATVHFRDMVGAGRVGIYALVAGSWRYTTWSGGGFVTSPSLTAQGDGQSDHTTVADLNGDGLPDLVYWQANAIWVLLNTSSNNSLSFSSTPLKLLNWTGRGSEFSSTDGTYSSYGWSFESPATSGGDGIFDVNGDGLEDIQIVWGGDQYLPTIPVRYAAFGGFHVFVDAMGSGPWSATTPALKLGFDSGAQQFGTFPSPGSGISDMRVSYYGHFNGDQCTDFTYLNTLYIAGCDGSVAKKLQIPPGREIVGLMDWNGDGRDDILTRTKGATSSPLVVSPAQGSVLGTDLSTPIFVGTGKILSADIDGDAQQDLLVTGTAGYFPHAAAGAPPDMLTKISDGFANTFRPKMASIAQGGPVTQGGYLATNNGVYPHSPYNGPLYVTTQYIATDGIGGEYTVSYLYQGGQMNLQGRGFEGFATVSMLDSRDSVRTDTTYMQAFPFTGFVSSRMRSVNPMLLGQNPYIPLLDRYEATYDAPTIQPVPAVVAPRLTSSTDTQYTPGFKSSVASVVSRSTYSYDSFGNVQNVTTTTSDLGGSTMTVGSGPTAGQWWTTTVQNQYLPDSAHNCLILPVQTTVIKSATNVDSDAQLIMFTNDYTQCRRTQAVVAPYSANYRVAIDYGYDLHGNINSETVTGGNMAPRTTSVTWGGDGRWPTAVTNAAGETTTFAYDAALGVQTSVVDPNGLVLKRTYDMFGRKLKETRPDGTATTWSFATNPCVTVPSRCSSQTPVAARIDVTELASDGGVINTGSTFFDSLGRPIINFDGIGESDVTYDQMGRVARRYMPCPSQCASSPTNFVRYTYDSWGRVIGEQRPISATNSTLQNQYYSYNGLRTATTDAMGKRTITWTDPNGWLRRSVDASGYYIDFSYDAFGNETQQMDSLGKILHTSQYAHGIGEFKVGEVDADRGRLTYTPNALGEVVSYTDAKGAVFSTTYDALSRPTLQTDASNTKRWKWGHDASSHNVGKLIFICVGDGSSCNRYSETYIYDGLTRLTNKKIISDATYFYDYSYSARTGKLDTLTYPVSTAGYRLKLAYEYAGAGGTLNGIKDANTGTVYWRANSMNASGRVTQESLGNGVVTRMGYDPITNWLGSVQAGVGGGAGIQNESYLFDLVGNVIQRQDNRQALTENFYYDDLYRLTSSTLNGTANLTATYDVMGNIATKSDVGAYDYTSTQSGCQYYPHQQPHAVRKAGGVVYCYDVNGNMIKSGFTTIVWTPSNKVKSIFRRTDTVTLEYDAFDQRMRQSVAVGSNLETTVYVGGLMEKVTAGIDTAFRHYIDAGNSRVLYVRHSNGVNNTFYVGKDHLGSSAVVSCGSDVSGCAVGSALVRGSYSAFGQRRGSNWRGAPSSAEMTGFSQVTRRGFTGEEMIDGFNLVNLNGRIYDAASGRFMSADPYGTVMTQPQSYNRYSYVGNNPLSRVDPTGYAGDCPAGTGDEFIVCGRIPPDPMPVPLGPHHDDSNPNDPSGDEIIVEGTPPHPEEDIDNIDVNGIRKKPQSQQCVRPPDNRSFGDKAADAIVGFGDAFLIPILVRKLFDIEGTVDYNSAAYNGGKIAGIIEGFVPMALEGAAAYSAAAAARGAPSVLNANRFLRIGPGRMPANGPRLPAGTSVPRASFGSDGLHLDLRSRIPTIPPFGALVGGGGC